MIFVLCDVSTQFLNSFLPNDFVPHIANHSQGRNCLVHCAGGSGRTGMVIAAIIKNLGVSHIKMFSDAGNEIW